METFDPDVFRSALHMLMTGLEDSSNPCVSMTSQIPGA
jgi:hypothetical protein